MDYIHHRIGDENPDDMYSIGEEVGRLRTILREHIAVRLHGRAEVAHAESPEGITSSDDLESNRGSTAECSRQNATMSEEHEEEVNEEQGGDHNGGMVGESDGNQIVQLHEEQDGVIVQPTDIISSQISEQTGITQVQQHALGQPRPRRRKATANRGMLSPDFGKRRR